MKKFLLFITFLQVSILMYAQAPTIQWQKTLGGSDAEEAYSIQQTIDGGYIIAGYAYSNDGNVSGNHGGNGDYWIVKLKSTGEPDWQKCMGGSGQDIANDIKQTADGGYIVVGSTQSNDGDVTGYKGFRDCWVVKLDNSGNIEWEKTLGGSLSDEGHSVQLTTDGGFIIAGETGSSDGDVTGNHGSGDLWVIKLTGTGEISWQKCLGGSDVDFGQAIQQTKEGGYIVAGYSASTDGDVSGNHGLGDIWVVKLDNSGNIEWERCLGGSSYEWIYNNSSITQTTDDGYIVTGYTTSADGDVSENHGFRDCWVVKLGKEGDLEWEKSLGGSNEDSGFSIKETIDGGFIIAGSTQPDNAYADLWIVKLNNTGTTVQWQKEMGGSGLDVAYSVQQTKDDGFIIAGATTSIDGDVTDNHGFWDIWVVKLGAEVLPVTWGDISVTHINNLNKIKWTTLSESNTSHFDIERSYDGIQFVKVGTTRAVGNYNGEVKYVYGDNNTTNGKVYYRIKQVDLDGKSEYSKIVSVQVKETLKEIKLYPNPANNQLYIGVPLISGKYEVRITNVNGKLVKQLLVPGNNSISMPIYDLADAVYFISVSDGNNKYQSKFVKNRK